MRRRRRSLLRVAACPCWARCLAVVESIENGIGPRPAERTWQAENEALRSEAGVDWTYPLPWVLEHAWVKHKVAIGWAERDAQVLAGLADLHGPLGAAFRERSARFAASSHALLDAAFAAAMRPERALTSAPARLFANLQGEDGLENLEAIWRPEALLALGIGGSFRTTCLVDAKAPRRCNFRTDDGWYAYIGREAFEGDDAFELQDSLTSSAFVQVQMGSAAFARSSTSREPTPRTTSTSCRPWRRSVWNASTARENGKSSSSETTTTTPRRANRGGHAVACSR